MLVVWLVGLAYSTVQVEAKSKVVKKDRTPKEPGSSDLKVTESQLLITIHYINLSRNVS